VISDFGLSQMVMDLSERPIGLTPSNPSFAPVRWSAPELIEDDACQPTLATDVWSFGCTAYSILTDKAPYHHRMKDGSIIRDIHIKIKPPGPEGLSLENAIKDMERILNIDCWSFSPFQRSGMAAIAARIECICDASKDT